MFYFLSKTLFYLLMPMTWISLGLIIALLFKKWRLIALRCTFLFFIVFSNPFLVNEMYLWWEYPPTKINEVGVYDVGIVLTGMSNSSKEPKDRIYAEKGIDRLLQAIRLYKEGKIKKIFIVGESENVNLKGEMIGKRRTYTYEHFLLQVGVRKEDIWIEPNSKNTYENAQFAAKFLMTQQLTKHNSNILLITSAFHLRRATACFEKANVKVKGFATDFYAKERKDALTPISLIPTEEAMGKWGRIVHEIIGYVVYDFTDKL